MNSMRDLFPEWYRPNAAAMLQLHRDATIVPDTNVLLAVYRMGKLASDIFDAFEMHKDRLWVPHQVALEYQRNRLRVINEQHKKFTDFQTAWSALAESIKATAKTGGDDLLAAMTQRLDSAHVAMFADIDAVRDENAQAEPTPAGRDPHRDRWDSLLDGRVNPRPTEEVVKARNGEAHKRAELSIPPGYLDTKKKEGQSEGDYLIWCEALEYAKTSERPLIFITNDKKADWYETVSGQTVGPRPELVREMHDLTGGQTYWQEDLQTFLFYSAKLLSEEVRPETIKRLEETATAGTGNTWSDRAKLALWSARATRLGGSADDLPRWIKDSTEVPPTPLDLRLDRDVLEIIGKLTTEGRPVDSTFMRLMNSLRSYVDECERLNEFGPQAETEEFTQSYLRAIRSKNRIQSFARGIALGGLDAAPAQGTLQDLDQVLDERKRNSF